MIPDIILDCSSTFFFGGGSLNQTQNLPTWLVLLVNLLWDPPPCEVEISGGSPHPLGVYVGSRDLNSAPHTGTTSILSTDLYSQPYLRFCNIVLLVGRPETVNQDLGEAWELGWDAQQVAPLHLLHALPHPHPQVKPSNLSS